MNGITWFRGEYAFLSNFYSCPIEFEGVTWKTAEHAYQAMKTDDLGWRQRIQRADTATRAKTLGRRAPLRYDWEACKIDVMRRILRAKFQHPTLRAKLQHTAPARLIECNNWGDAFWGMTLHYQGWRGENWLGRLLEEIRAEIDPPLDQLTKKLLDR